MVEVMGEKFELEKATTLLELSRMVKTKFENEIILAKVNNKLRDLIDTIYPQNDYKVEFLDISDPNGFRTYQRSITFVLIYAIKSILGKKTRVLIEHSINKNYYCEIAGVNVSENLLRQIENKMYDVIKNDIPIQKLSLPSESVNTIMKDFCEDDNRFKFRRNTNFNLYKLDWYYDYYYGTMLPSTGYIKKFFLHPKLNGFVVQFPSFDNPYKFEEIKPNEKISQVFLESSHWLKIMNLQTVASLNEKISNGHINQLIYLSEALHENKIVNIASEICSGKKKIILIGGPTSSGKTTFAHRLYVQLRVNGLKPYVISIDDYFLNREDSPIDENGKHDFERLEALDTDKLNKDLEMLLAGKEVELPKFNFVTGHREKSGKFIKLESNDVLIMEGIHGLNEKLTAKIDRDHKFKIFVSALTQLNIDDHNRISTTDTRLVRRIVRDNQFRGFSAKNTIGMWKSVTRGENNYIFPYQEEADAFFNSSLVYEMSILKQYATSLLYNISEDEEEYCEANRLIRFLDSFLVLNPKHVPRNSILREFIGGSCFY